MAAPPLARRSKEIRADLLAGALWRTNSRASVEREWRLPGRNLITSRHELGKWAGRLTLRKTTASQKLTSYVVPLPLNTDNHVAPTPRAADFCRARVGLSAWFTPHASGGLKADRGKGGRIFPL